MKKSEDLFHLIKSLSRSEKGYLKKYAFSDSAGEEKNYFRLFDAIDEQEEYDEEKILKKFEDEQFVKQIHRVKNYLLHLILKSMRAYHSQHSVETVLKERLQDVFFLHEKGLYPQAQKLLRSAKELAYQYEKFAPLLEILDWQRKIISLEAYSLAYAITLDEIIRERETVMERQKNLHIYERIFDSLDPLIKERNVMRTESEILPMKKLIRNPLLKDERKALSHKARILFYYILGAYHFGSADWEKAYGVTELRRKIIESRPDLIEENPEDYITVLKHLVYFHLHRADFREFRTLLDRLKSLPAKTREIRALVFEASYIQELYYCIKLGLFSEGVLLIEKIETEMPLYESLVNPVTRMDFNFHFAYLFFATQQYNTALKYVNEVINNKTVELRKDLLGYARILNMMIHYELGNEDLIEYAIPSAKRFLGKNTELLPTEKLILSFFQHLVMRKPKGEELKNCFQQLRTDLIARTNTSSPEKIIPEVYQFIFWLESKIKGVPLEAVIKKHIAA